MGSLVSPKLLLLALAVAGVAAIGGCGSGNGAGSVHVAVYVYRATAPGVTVIDQGGLLNLTQVEAIARAVIAG